MQASDRGRLAPDELSDRGRLARNELSDRGRLARNEREARTHSEYGLCLKSLGRRVPIWLCRLGAR